jgi:hypothetical protein
MISMRSNPGEPQRSNPPGSRHGKASADPSTRRFASGLVLLTLLAGLGFGARPIWSAPEPRLEDFIAPPGAKQTLKPFMLHADWWNGLDRRVHLDSTVYALENGARCCRVLGSDSLWAVDYTWIYPHDLFPPRWYDARDLIRVGDSLAIPEAAAIRFTFGTYRIGVHAKSFEQAHAEALRLWPATMPPPLAGRLKLKLERARNALAHPDSSRAVK